MRPTYASLLSLIPLPGPTNTPSCSSLYKQSHINPACSISYGSGGFSISQQEAFTYVPNNRSASSTPNPWNNADSTCNWLSEKRSVSTATVSVSPTSRAEAITTGQPRRKRVSLPRKQSVRNIRTKSNPRPVKSAVRPEKIWAPSFWSVLGFFLSGIFLIIAADAELLFPWMRGRKSLADYDGF